MVMVFYFIFFLHYWTCIENLVFKAISKGNMVITFRHYKKNTKMFMGDLIFLWLTDNVVGPKKNLFNYFKYEY